MASKKRTRDKLPIIFNALCELFLKKIPLQSQEAYYQIIINDINSCSKEDLTREFVIGDKCEISQRIWGWKIDTLTIIHLSAMVDNLDIIETVVKRGISINTQIRVTAFNKYLPLHCAILTRQPLMIKKIKELGGNFNEPFKNGFLNPLIFAYFTIIQCFEMCLRCGSNPDCFIDTAGVNATLFHECVLRQKYIHIRLLLDYKADPYIQNISGYSVWHFLCSMCPYDIICIKLFLDYGINIDFDSEQGYTGTHYLESSDYKEEHVKTIYQYKLKNFLQDKKEKESVLETSCSREYRN